MYERQRYQCQQQKKGMNWKNKIKSEHEMWKYQTTTHGSMHVNIILMINSIGTYWSAFHTRESRTNWFSSCVWKWYCHKRLLLYIAYREIMPIQNATSLIE